MPCGSGICGSCCGVLHIIAAAFDHTRSCEKGEVAAARCLEAVGNEVVAGSVGQRVVAIGSIADAGCDKGIALLGVGDGAAAGAATLCTPGTDSDACASNLNIGVVVAVEPFLGTSLGRIGEDGTIADGDGSASAGIAVNGIIAIAVADGDAAIEVDIATAVDAVVVALEVVLAASDGDRGLGLQTFCAIGGGIDFCRAAGDGDGSLYLDALC